MKNHMNLWCVAHPITLMYFFCGVLKKNVETNFKCAVMRGIEKMIDSPVPHNTAKN